MKTCCTTCTSKDHKTFTKNTEVKSNNSNMTQLDNCFVQKNNSAIVECQCGTSGPNTNHNYTSTVSTLYTNTIWSNDLEPVEVELGLTSHQAHYMSYRGQGSNDPTNSVKALKEDRLPRIRLQSHQAHPTALTIIQQICSMKKTQNIQR